MEGGAVRTPIPLVDIAAQHASVADDVEARVLAVLRSGQYIGGAEVEELEQEFAAYCGVKYAVAVNSGTAALHAALYALGIGPGDEVITVSHTFAATAEAIVATGATPVFVDIDPLTFNMDPAAVRAAISPRTRAILPVHLYGRIAPMREILEIADAHGLAVVEDACQAHGARSEGQRAGSFGAIGCFSFYPSKNLGAAGEGGIAVTNSAELAAKMRQLADHGQSRRYEHAVSGYNYRLPALQASVLRVKLRRLDEWNERRRQHAVAYARGLSELGLVLPVSAGEAGSVYHLYVVRSDERDALARHLADASIGTGVHYPVPVHLQPAFDGNSRTVGTLPHTVAAANEVLSLPMYAELTTDQLECVVGAVRAFAAQTVLAR